MRQKAAALDRLLTPLVVFLCLYVATLFVIGWFRLPLGYWGGLLAVSLATAVTIAWRERNRWHVGLATPLSSFIRDLGLGSILGFLVVSAAGLAIVLTSSQRHVDGAGLPWRELLAVYLPAVLHEELLFRGYPFQKLHAWNRSVALIGVAAVFAILHLGNSGVTPIGATNIFLGGILLGLAWEASRSLWLPIAIHFAWNVTSGPIFGHEVSGWVPASSVLIEIPAGPVWLTGGSFGIEGSIWMTASTLAAIFAVHYAGRRRGQARAPIGRVSPSSGLRPPSPH